MYNIHKNTRTEQLFSQRFVQDQLSQSSNWQAHGLQFFKSRPPWCKTCCDETASCNWERVHTDNFIVVGGGSSDLRGAPSARSLGVGVAGGRGQNCKETNNGIYQKTVCRRGKISWGVLCSGRRMEKTIYVCVSRKENPPPSFRILLLVVSRGVEVWLQ